MSAVGVGAPVIELQVPPHSIDAEQSVLGSLLIDNNSAGRIIDIVTESDFYRDDHRRIFRHVVRLIERGEPADVVTIDEAIKASEDADKTGGITYLAALAGNTPSAHNVRRYAEIVRDAARQRKLMEIGGELQDLAGRHGADPATIRAEVEAKLLAIDAPGPGAWPASLDLKALAECDPEKPGFIMADWLPVGYASLLSAHGGVGKSGIALNLGVCIAAEVPFWGLDVGRRRVMYLSCEDRAGLLHWRLSRICPHLGVDLASLHDWLEIVDLVGRDTVLWERDPRTGETLTPAYGRLAERVRRAQTELLIVDGISDTYAGSGGSKTEVKRFVNALVALIPPARGAVLLIGHIDKKAAKDGAGSEGYDGTAGWHNSCRSRWYLYPETAEGEDGGRPQRTGELVLELQKSNLGPLDRTMRFRWDEPAHMFLGEVVGVSTFDRRHQDREERTGILRALLGCRAATPPIVVPAAMQGQRTAFHVLSLRPEFPKALVSKPAARRFRRQMEELRQSRAIEEVEYRRSNRHLSSQLILTSEGVRQCAE